jgi:hypothetical protein
VLRLALWRRGRVIREPLLNVGGAAQVVIAQNRLLGLSSAPMPFGQALAASTKRPRPTSERGG